MEIKIKGCYQDRTVFINGKELSPGRSQKLRNHSPDGFAWGYGGSGPAQLALAILLEITKDKQFALKNYQDFKWDIICDLPMEEDFTLEEKIVSTWIAKRLIRNISMTGTVKGQ